jgi:hypothetical protein
VVLVDRGDEVGLAVSALAGLSQLSQGLMQDDEATIFVHGLTAELPADAKVEVDCGRTRICSRSETLHEQTSPRYYDAYRMKHEVHGQKFVVVRPDRFVYAACSNTDELQRTAKSMPQALIISTS